MPLRRAGAMRPSPEYARCGDLHIAYQVIGEGPDLVWIPGWISNVGHWWEHPLPSSFIRRLASFCRVILFDKRGTGLSDRHGEVPGIDERLDDLQAVLDAVGVERAALLGITFEGGAIGSLFAAMHPERISRLILYGATPKFLASEDFPWGVPSERFEELLTVLGDSWTAGTFAVERMAPSHGDDDSLREWFGRWGRVSASPGAAIEMFRRVGRIDDAPVRAVRCAIDIARSLEDLDIQTRSGLHTGECEVVGDDLIGLAVHVAFRVMSQAGPGEVIVSSGVRDLVEGSDVEFEDRGVHALKGVPGRWPLYAAQAR